MCYRMYSNDKVVVIIPKAKAECLTPIGRLTGLEPKTLFCRWWPSKECFVGRPVEGSYLLDKVPGLQPGQEMSLAPLPDACSDEMTTSSGKLLLHYPKADDGDRELWRTWLARFVPHANETAAEFSRRVTVFTPLHEFFKVGVQHTGHEESAIWRVGAPTSTTSLFEVEWPMHAALALASVNCRFGRTANPDPFFQVRLGALDTVLGSYQVHATSPPYVDKLQKLQKRGLVAVAKRRMHASGRAFPHAGTIPVLIAGLSAWNATFVAGRLDVLSADQTNIVLDMEATGCSGRFGSGDNVWILQEPILPLSLFRQALISVNGCAGSTGADYSSKLVDLCLLLHTQRDKRLVTTFNEINNVGAHKSKMRPCKFLPSSVAETIIRCSFSLDALVVQPDIANIFTADDFGFFQTHSVFVPWWDTVSHLWLLLVLRPYNDDSVDKAPTVHLHYPQFASIDDVDKTIQTARLLEVESHLVPLVKHFQQAHDAHVQSQLDQAARVLAAAAGDVPQTAAAIATAAAAATAAAQAQQLPQQGNRGGVVRLREVGRGGCRGGGRVAAQAGGRGEQQPPLPLPWTVRAACKSLVYERDIIMASVPRGQWLSGLFMLLLLEFEYFHIDLYFRPDDIIPLRNRLAYALLSSRLQNID